MEIKTMYKIVINRASNDFNNEPEHIVIPYEILGEKEDLYLVVRKGWGRAKKQQHYLPKIQFYKTKEEAEKNIKI